MLTRMVRVMLRWPLLRRLFWRRWYQALTKRRQQSDFVFMNYGYIILNESEVAPALEPVHEAQRNWIQLYHHVVSKADIAGKQVLEVGSGRGGGAAYVHHYLKPAEMLGLDLASRAVEFSNRVHVADGLSYLQGDAEDLPLEDSSRDVVVNVESSHCYGSMRKFLAEVSRVLRPGGYFCYADLRTVEGAATLRQELEATGMNIVRQEDLAPNVMAALREDNAMKRDYIQKEAPKWLQEPLETFAGVEGSAIWRGLESGGTLYPHYLMQKPVA